jgi:hypothetical protein
VREHLTKVAAANSKIQEQEENRQILYFLRD